MKFPLPLDTFPDVALSEHEKRDLEAVAATVVKHTMREYHEHLTQNDGTVDGRRWKRIKHRDDVRVYSERCAPRGGLADDPELEGVQLASMLAFGTIEGRLEDVLYGVMCPTTEAMRLKTAYVQNGFEDWKVIASIREPSENDPLRELNIKWTVKGHPHFVGMVINARDALYIESVGTAQTLNGERIGYLLQHSVKLPGIRELTEYQIVRSRISFCYIFRQVAGNRVEVFERGIFSPMGDAPVALAIASTAEISIAISRSLHCSEMKKLTRLARQGSGLSLSSSTTHDSSKSSASSGSVDSASDPSSASGVCSQCSKSTSSKFKLSSTSKEKRCRICLARVCCRCRVHKTVYQPAKLKELTAANMAFCTRCLLRVTSAHSSDFAVLDARAACGEEVDYLSALEA